MKRLNGKFCICGSPLAGRERLYCSRKCNHRAETARRKLREAQAAATKLEADVAAIPTSDPITPQFAMPGSLVCIERPPSVTLSPPSLWQRFRKRLASTWATLVYLFQEHQGN